MSSKPTRYKPAPQRIEQKRRVLAEIEAQKLRLAQAGGVKTSREIHVSVSAAQRVEAELGNRCAVYGVVAAAVRCAPGR
ncbi:MAG: hypothetical protein U0694_18335 [Anaerolineae bacterium]